MMDRQNIRLFFLFSLIFVGMLLYNAWQQEVVSKTPLQPTTASTEVAIDLPRPLPPEQLQTSLESNSASDEIVALDNKADRLVRVVTDVLDLQIDTLGGDIVYLSLPEYPKQQNQPEQGVVLLNESPELYHVIQSGLLAESGPDSQRLGRAHYTADVSSVSLGAKEQTLNVDLHYKTATNVKITKRFVFTRASYKVTMQYIVDNQGTKAYQASLFGRLKRKPPATNKTGMMGAMRTEAYKKITFKDMNKKPFKEQIIGGWVAMVEHYFTTAWIPNATQKHYYQSESLGNDVYGVRFISPPVIVQPNETTTVQAEFYAGPEITDVLKSISPGLELSVDYGVLWWLCQPIFALLKWIYKLVGNWGVAIILTTFVIKVLFYKLSATSYRSMGNMRRIQPRIEALKERYGDNKQQFGQAMMAMYKQEKINPLGGCLPILVQIPVFIALYWVLLESVELRQAPFALWIQDLSAKDPYYVLPLLMGFSMFVQQKLNPTPPDPIQAKVMMFMPILFTFLFFQFPAGLVLYWVVNNVLSILQQWFITRKVVAS